MVSACLKLEHPQVSFADEYSGYDPAYRKIIGLETGDVLHESRGHFLILFSMCV